MTLAVIAIASIMGVAVGAVAGYRGGSVDDLLMRGTEAAQIVMSLRSRMGAAETMAWDRSGALLVVAVVAGRTVRRDTSGW